MIVDAHHHLWDPSTRDYPWMTGPAEVLRRRFGLDDLRTATCSAGVGSTVVVQAASDVDETRELLVTSEASDGLIGGVVGWVDLTAPDLRDHLGRLRAGAGGSRLVGVRHQVHDEADPGWLIRDDVLRGLRVLADEGLAYDLLVRTRELPAAVRAARAVDGLSFVLDHGAKPPISSGEVEPWATKVGELATLPNVTCKISGLVTEDTWTEWTTDRLVTYVNRLIDVFTPQRLMFGSDWPVCTLAADYYEVLDVARQMTATLTFAEADAIFQGTAKRVYRLG